MKSILWLFIFCFGSTIAQIGAKVQQQGKVTGIWQNNQFGYQMTLILNENATGEFDGDAIQYSIKENNLTITQSGATNKYTFLLQGNSLTLSGGDLDQPITFARQGTAQGEEKKSLPSSNASDELIGIWSGNGESIEFKDNQQCIYLGKSFPYEVSNGNVTLVTTQGRLMMAYTVTNNQLTLTLNGKALIYQKGSAPSNNVGSGNVAQELVGKWCYVNVNSTSSGGSSTSNCITLNADGSYEYYGESSRSVNTTSFYGGTSSQSSDRGTWYVQGDRIYYNSPTRGQGSYQLQKQNHPKNGDPMILLDGETYVTFYNKSPWR